MFGPPIPAEDDGRTDGPLIGTDADADEGFTLERSRRHYGRHSALLFSLLAVPPSSAIRISFLVKVSVKGDTVPRRNLRCGKTNTESDTSPSLPLSLPK